MKKIIKIYKKIKFVIKKLFVICVRKIIGIFIIRNKNYIIFNSCPMNKDSFCHNTKYTFLYFNHCLKKSNFKVFWICDDKDMISVFKQHGYENIIQRNTLKGMYYMLKSKYWFLDFEAVDLPQYFIHNAIIIDFFHGSGIKRIGYDTNDNFNKYSKLEQLIFKFFVMEKDFIWVVNSEHEANCYKTAYFAKDKNIKYLGSPRLDALYHDFPNQEMFMEEDYENIKKLKEQGKNLIFYMPTWRDTGKDISGWLKSETLHNFLSANNAVLVCKLHPFDTNSLNFDLPDSFYKMDSKSDIYAVLKYADSVITDYSTIALDFLLLDRPIVYYIPDLVEYETQCRGFFVPFETMTAGIKTETEEELLSALQNVINGIDNYKEERKVLRDRLFVHQDGKNCERVVEFIKELSK